jgi:hypothetical protein
MSQNFFRRDLRAALRQSPLRRVDNKCPRLHEVRIDRVKAARIIFDATRTVDRTCNPVHRYSQRSIRQTSPMFCRNGLIEHVGKGPRWFGSNPCAQDFGAMAKE